MMKRHRRLIDIVKREAFEWGDNVAVAYHDVAASHMNDHWNEIIWPVLSQYDVDFSVTMDFACGHGRNARKLKECGAAHVTLVDVNPENIRYCNKHLVPLGGYRTFLNSGFDLTGLPSGQFTHVYSFDSMVHFDLEIVLSYIAEFARVLKPGGTAFIHHSNFTETPGTSFRDNPHWRNFMSATIFAHSAIRNGFAVLEQKLVNWGERPIDCVTMMRRG